MISSRPSDEADHLVNPHRDPCSTLADRCVRELELAAAAALARYSGRTIDAYRHDLQGYFQWAADNQVPVLGGTRIHIELYRSWMGQRGLAASTIDRRLSTVSGFSRFAHIDGPHRVEPGPYVAGRQLRAGGREQEQEPEGHDRARR
jgi:site-specific recombinase XerC